MGTVWQLLGVGHKVDANEPRVLVPLCTCCQGSRGIFIEEIVGLEQKAHCFPQSLCWYVPGMGDVQETGCHPSHQILQSST